MPLCRECFNEKSRIQKEQNEEESSGSESTDNAENNNADGFLLHHADLVDKSPDTKAKAFIESDSEKKFEIGADATVKMPRKVEGRRDSDMTVSFKEAESPVELRQKP